MIVLDEQLLGRNIEQEISKWYGGKVLYIIDLRPNTIIKDDAIPGLLRQQNQPTFVTINEKDFWRKVDVDDRFCIVCLALPDSQVQEISNHLNTIQQKNNNLSNLKKTLEQYKIEIDILRNIFKKRISDNRIINELNNMKDNFDINAGAIIDGEKTIREVGEEIFELLIKVADGRQTRAERNRQNQFAIRQEGFIYPSLREIAEKGL